MKLSIGFDVSKSTVDAALFDGIRTEHFQVENSEEGFKMVLEKAGGYALEDIMVTMEATGVYHHRCASFFDSRGFFVSVVNPLIIKRYTDMRMSRVKTDKADAKQIARYGWSQQAYRYKAPSEKCQKIRAFLKVIEGLKREKTQHRNRLEALAQFASDMSEIAALHYAIIQHLDTQIRQAEPAVALDQEAAAARKVPLSLGQAARQHEAAGDEEDLRRARVRLEPVEQSAGERRREVAQRRVKREVMQHDRQRAKSAQRIEQGQARSRGAARGGR